MLYLMMAAILTMGFAACSSTDDDEEGEQPEKQKPEVPISDSDWQTVPAGLTPSRGNSPTSK